MASNDAGTMIILTAFALFNAAVTAVNCKMRVPALLPVSSAVPTLARSCSALLWAVSVIIQDLYFIGQLSFFTSRCFSAARVGGPLNRPLCCHKQDDKKWQPMIAT